LEWSSAVISVHGTSSGIASSVVPCCKQGDALQDGSICEHKRLRSKCRHCADEKVVDDSGVEDTYIYIHTYISVYVYLCVYMHVYMYRCLIC